jgi:hypothetical protein
MESGGGAHAVLDQPRRHPAAAAKAALIAPLGLRPAPARRVGLIFVNQR